MTHLVYADPGEIRGFNISYSSTTAINTPGGFCRANGKEYYSVSAATHSMTSLAAGFDHHYIYIDDDASTAPAATIIDATTEPTWSDTKNGWYNGDDRMIGVVESPDASATIATFYTYSLGDKFIRNENGRLTLPAMASDMNPTAAWQVPDDNDGDIMTPVNAVAIKIIMTNSDPAGPLGLYSTNKEQGEIEASVINGLSQYYLYNTALITQPYFALGASRKIYIAGSDNDDNALDAWMVGYGYTR